MSNQNKSHRSLLYVVSIAIALLLVGSALSSTIAQTASEGSDEPETKKTDSHSKSTEDDSGSEPVDFSREGHSGQQVAGDSRSGRGSQLGYLSAIVPKSNLSKTAASHPRWWFYFPFGGSQIKQIEFVLQNAEEETLLRKNISVPTKSNYFSVGVPAEFPGLEAKQQYVWYLKLHRSLDRVPIYVSGVVERVSVSDVAENNASALEYSQQDLWLDAVALLFANRARVSEESWHRSWQKIVGSQTIDLQLDPPEIIN